MAREGHKAQKRTYVAPETRNVVSRRTMSYDRRNPSSAVGKRAFDLMTNRRYGGRSFTRNYERIQRAASNMQRQLRG